LLSRPSLASEDQLSKSNGLAQSKSIAAQICAHLVDAFRYLTTCSSLSRLTIMEQATAMKMEAPRTAT